MVAISRVHLRAKPGFAGEVVRVVEVGEEVEVHEIKNLWAKVDEGFILAEFLEKK